MSISGPYEGIRRRLQAVDRRRLLKPYSGSEAIDTALRLYQRTAWPILRATVWPMGLCLVGLSFYGAFAFPSLFLSRAESLPGELTELLFVGAVGLGVALPLFAAGLGLSAAATVPAIAAQVMGEPPPRRGGALRATLAQLGATLLTLLATIGPALVCGFGIVVGSVAERSGAQNGLTDAVSVLSILGLATVGWMVVPIGLHFFSLAPVVAVVEGRGALASLKRSLRLVRSVRYQSPAAGVTLGAFLLVSLLGLGLYGTLAALLALAGLAAFVDRALAGTGLSQIAAGVVASLPAYVTLWFLVPVWTSVATVLYYDRIVRLEAFDIKVLTEDIEREKRRTPLLG